MKKSVLRKIIVEEIKNVLKEDFEPLPLVASVIDKNTGKEVKKFGMLIKSKNDFKNKAKKLNLKRKENVNFYIEIHPPKDKISKLSKEQEDFLFDFVNGLEGFEVRY